MIEFVDADGSPTQTRAAMRGVWIVVIGALVLAAGCQPVRSTAIVTGRKHAAYQGAVQLRSFAPDEEDEAEELGIVEARGIGVTLEPIAEEFRARVARIGGDLGVIDRVRTRFELVTRTESYSYNCGSTKEPRTCYGTRVVTDEVATTTLSGRAFRTQ